jgi:hypothetical protein
MPLDVEEIPIKLVASARAILDQARTPAAENNGRHAGQRFLNSRFNPPTGSAIGAAIAELTTYKSRLGQ